MTIGLVLRAAAAWLAGHGVEDARLTAELLLAHALDITRAGVMARLNDALAPGAQERLDLLLGRRARGEPLAYILGQREFYGLSFAVGPGVLIPRPETELLVEEVRAFAAGGGLRRIVDVGTGAGAIAIALAVHLPESSILAIDLSPMALDVAGRNVDAHAVGDRVELRLGDLLDGVDGPFDAIVSNPPYVPTETVDTLDRSVRDWEPRMALDGGADGLDPHRRLLEQVPGRLRSGGLLLLEIADDRGPLARSLVADALPNAEVRLLVDAFGRDRAIRAIV